MVEPEILSQSLSHIADVSLIVCNQVLMLKIFIIALDRLHVGESVEVLEEPDKDYFLGQLRVDLDQDLQRLQIPKACDRELLPPRVDSLRLRSLEVALDKNVVEDSNGPGNDFGDILSNELSPGKAQNVPHFLVGVHYCA